MALRILEKGVIWENGGNGIRVSKRTQKSTYKGWSYFEKLRMKDLKAGKRDSQEWNYPGKNDDNSWAFEISKSRQKWLYETSYPKKCIRVSKRTKKIE